jgi:uncharacterized protein with PIN domain
VRAASPCSGCDTELLKQYDPIRLVAWAEEEDRILLTRDSKLKSPSLFYLPSHDTAQQLYAAGKKMKCRCRLHAPIRVPLTVSPYPLVCSFPCPPPPFPLTSVLLTEHFGLVCSFGDLMSRCARCNGLGYDEITAEAARAFGGIQEKVLNAVTQFWQCRRCSKVYWEGPKFETTRETFGAMVGATLLPEGAAAPKSEGDASDGAKDA